MKKTILSCLIAFMSMGFVHAEGKFYLKPSVVQWGMDGAVFGATFKDAFGIESDVIRSKPTESNPYIYELDIPDGEWTQIRPRRYAPDWEDEWEITEVGYFTYGTNNFITIIEWIGTHLSTYNSPVLSNTKFYLDITGSVWATPLVLEESFFIAAFQDADNSAIYEIVFKPTTVPTIYEVNVPVGNITKVSVERYLIQTQALSAPDQKEEYVYNGISNCALVIGWFLESYLIDYTPVVFSDTKFYLDISGSDWETPGVLAESFFKATFYNASNSAICEVEFQPTSVPSIYEVNVPVGSITKVRVERYLVSTQASAGGDQGEEYNYNGTLNCAFVTGWVLAPNLTSYMPTSARLVELVDTKIFVDGNQIVASFSKSADVKLYTVTGQLLYTNQASLSFAYTVSSAGIYLLTVNGQAYKVLVP